MNKLQAAEQLRRAIQMYAASLADEQALEIPSIYPAWEVGKTYTQGDIITYGENNVGDPQLYRVAQGHTSQADWLPNALPALYTPIGLAPAGYPKWSQPTGAHDAYNTGDIVDYNGTLYKSNINGNTTVPGTDERWWSVYTEG